MHRDVFCATYWGHCPLKRASEPSHVTQNHERYQMHPEPCQTRAYSLRKTRFGRPARDFACLGPHSAENSRIHATTVKNKIITFHGISSLCRYHSLLRCCNIINWVTAHPLISILQPAHLLNRLHSSSSADVLGRACIGSSQLPELRILCFFLSLSRCCVCSTTASSTMSLSKC